MPSSCSLTVEVERARWERERRLTCLMLRFTSGLGEVARIEVGCPLADAGEFAPGDGFVIDLREAFREARENGGGTCGEGAGK